MAVRPPFRRGMTPAVPSPFVEAIGVVRDAGARHGFRVALIGGFALPFHGIRRTTGDVDFLVEAAGADALHEALLAAGWVSLHRSADAANYRGGSVGIDVIFARRPPTRAMLARAGTPSDRVDVPVVDVEGIIGLKLQAMVNDPTRRRRDEADIVDLLTLHLPHVDRALLREYFELFGEADALARFIDEARRRRG